MQLTIKEIIMYRKGLMYILAEKMCDSADD